MCCEQRTLELAARERADGAGPEAGKADRLDRVMGQREILSADRIEEVERRQAPRATRSSTLTGKWRSISAICGR